MTKFLALTSLLALSVPAFAGGGDASFPFDVLIVSSPDRSFKDDGTVVQVENQPDSYTISEEATDCTSAAEVVLVKHSRAKARAACAKVNDTRRVFTNLKDIGCKVVDSGTMPVKVPGGGFACVGWARIKGFRQGRTFVE